MTEFGTTLPTPGGSNNTWGTGLNTTLTAAEDWVARVQGTFTIAPVDAQAEYLVFDSRIPFDVKRVTYQCLPSGTATLNFKINSTDITGLSSLSATASEQTSTASGANSVTIGDNLILTPSSIDPAVSRIVIALWGDQTAVGQSA